MNSTEPQTTEQQSSGNTTFSLEKHTERGTPIPVGRLRDRTFTSLADLAHYVNRLIKPGIYLVSSREDGTLLGQQELTRNADGSVAIKEDGHYQFGAAGLTYLPDQPVAVVVAATHSTLTAQYPTISFKVTEGRWHHQVDSSLKVSYEDGPTSSEVATLCEPYLADRLPEGGNYERQPIKLGVERIFCYILQQITVQRTCSLAYFEQVAALAQCLQIKAEAEQACRIAGSSYNRSDTPATEWLITTAKLLTPEQVAAATVSLSRPA